MGKVRLPRVVPLLTAQGRTTTGMVCACLLKEAAAAANGSSEHSVRGARERSPDVWETYSAAHAVDSLHKHAYEVVDAVVGLVPDGIEAKAQLDRLMDATGPPSGLQNLRDCIHWTKEKYEEEVGGRRPHGDTDSCGSRRRRSHIGSGWRGTSSRDTAT